MRTSSSAGAEAIVEFEGTGAIISGYYLPSGGPADICLDGELNRTVDVYPDESAPKGWESVWRDCGLEDGQYTLRVVVRDETYSSSTGSGIALAHLIVFR